MKIKQIDDPHNLIHSYVLFKINEHDYKFIIRLNKYCEPFKLHGSTILNIIHDDMQNTEVAEIELDFCGSQFEEFKLHRNGVIAYIFDDCMRTKQVEVVERYGN